MSAHSSMIKVKQDRRAARFARRGDAVGVATQHKACQSSLPLFRLHDLFVGGALLRELERRAGVHDSKVEIKLVESRRDLKGPLRLAALHNRLDRLRKVEACPVDDVAPCAP